MSVTTSLKQNFVYVAAILITSISNVVYALPAFPGAEGVGTSTVHGRGGQVIKVTNLNSDGPGSFRDAVRASGPRIVVFEVSGVIELTSRLTINNPYLYIAGQTSPNGVTIAGRHIRVATHDVLMQYMRIRPGSHNIDDADSHRCFTVRGNSENSNDLNAYNVVIDHNSFSWSTDQCVNAWNGATDVTFSWNSITEPLNSSASGHNEDEHGFHFFFWGKNSNNSDSFSVHHNYLSHGDARSPEINFRGRLDMVNNVVYNTNSGVALSMSQSSSSGGETRVNALHNFYKAGLSLRSSNDDKSILRVKGPSGGNDCGTTPLLYSAGNLGQIRTSQSDPDSLAAQYNASSPFSNNPLNTNCLAPVPFAFNDTPVTVTTMSASYAQEVVDGAGATRPFRDSVDTRVALDFVNGTGVTKDVMSSNPAVGYTAANDDYHDHETGALAPPVDSDNDGMADAWEIANGFIVGANDSAGDADGDGYTNIEEYLHELAGVTGEQENTGSNAAPSSLIIDESDFEVNNQRNI